MTRYIADYCDTYPDKVSVLGPGFTSYGGAVRCQGEIVTIQLDRNNSDLITLLRDENGRGKVVVVDARQAYFAIVGENLMKFAQASGYAGIIVNGYIRDTVQIADIPVALFALGICPRKYIPVTGGTRDIPLSFGGIEFRPGDYIYADADGVIVTKEAFETS
ncbi:MAG: ribonuclease E activity regulator RraA [Rhodothermales bacterium]|nr:ribonuclease E activity regulator RraA [Rhodothermales bacterium]